MTNEPECPLGMCHADCESCVCLCAALRTAYQRGREDAARDIADMDDLTGYDLDGLVRQADAIAAARGDGERSE